jgi:hypothetical protein
MRSNEYDRKRIHGGRFLGLICEGRRGPRPLGQVAIVLNRTRLLAKRTGGRKVAASSAAVIEPVPRKSDKRVNSKSVTSRVGKSSADQSSAGGSKLLVLRL